MKTIIGLTLDYLQKNIPKEDYAKFINQECLNGWNYVGCLSRGIAKQADWHNAQTCSKCNPEDKNFYLQMAFCKECLPGNVTITIEI